MSSTSFGLYRSRKRFQRMVVQAVTAPRQLRHLLLHRAMMAAVPALGPWTLLTTTRRAQKVKPKVSNSRSNITSNREALIFEVVGLLSHVH